jgi:hypothetical protein
MLPQSSVYGYAVVICAGLSLAALETMPAVSDIGVDVARLGWQRISSDRNLRNSAVCFRGGATVAMRR